ncbi:hypothetical protein WICPIJ_006278 [Wickerhamomyces pijperi]|uniref:Uncharacterized protein n=1 Tax=Wickerhamomyces pijperi TaxID=599730 RepID=A0A9P8Q247_WICPI|nr:hypothetical protein WICPIJ_006277 [Wickerhamomyces pijperi]KAH3682743.1 hypothetical protein WICPIJ_006278 [Wickerhamomyces pijperi]
MFSSSILRAALSVSSQAAKQSAPKAIRVTVNSNTLLQYGKLYLSRVPTVIQWGLGLSTVLFWPQYASVLVKARGVNRV